MISKLRNKSSSFFVKIFSARALQALWGTLILLLFTTSMASGTPRTHIYRTISTVNPRPMAMGGAFVSVNDDLASLLWNPAAFSLYETEVTNQLSAHFNPIIPLVLLYEDHRNVADFLTALGASVKAITFSHRWAEMGLLLWEEPFYNPTASGHGRFFNADRTLKHTMHTLGLRARLATTVSLGCSGNLYRIRNERGKVVLAGALNYGALLKPARGLVVGLAYFDFPSPLADLRWELEGLRDESINGSISFHPDDRTIVAMDVRDVSGGERINWNRLRFGFERTFWERIALRFGYFQVSRQEHKVYSFGLGLMGRGLGAIPYNHKSYLANYALLVEENEGQQRLWHLLCVQLCI
ncbi:MAG: hypothetical protein AMJ92_12955 [candidate division Zixibacteria bacterium SM23_81]|nr:MAG: hypothetical protein AMJ92_12955 [candidate division Zixibacteria bacterium SM23_81]